MNPRATDSGSKAKNSHRTKKSDIKEGAKPSNTNSEPSTNREPSDNGELSKNGGRAKVNARAVASLALVDVLVKQRNLSQAKASLASRDDLSDRDKAFAFAILTVSLRRLAYLRKLVNSRLARPLPENLPLIEAVMITALAQHLFMRVPAHAIVNEATGIVGRNRQTKGFRALVNAVLRRLVALSLSECDEIARGTVDIAPWLAQRWRKFYGEARVNEIASVVIHEPKLALSFQSPDAAQAFSSKYDCPMFAGSPELAVDFSASDVEFTGNSVRSVPGYLAGNWWIQDPAAALAVRLLARELVKRTKKSTRVLELCASPGGKTAQLLSLGLDVRAVDREVRMALLATNLERLVAHYDASALSLEAADACNYRATQAYDAVLLDPPCLSTGTLRRHPEVSWIKRQEQITENTKKQRRMLASAFKALSIGGLLIYSVCSLEPEEGNEQINKFLAEHRKRLEIVKLDSDILSPFAYEELDCGVVIFPGTSNDGFFISLLRKI